jgi:hypothetical protein
MDSNGSRELARLLEERNGAAPPPVRGKQLRSTAAPIFHWFGIEPPPVLPSAAEEAEEAPSRRLRLAG